MGLGFVVVVGAPFGEFGEVFFEAGFELFEDGDWVGHVVVSCAAPPRFCGGPLGWWLVGFPVCHALLLFMFCSVFAAYPCFVVVVAEDVGAACVVVV